MSRLSASTVETLITIARAACYRKTVIQILFRWILARIGCVCLYAAGMMCVDSARVIQRASDWVL